MSVAVMTIGIIFIFINEKFSDKNAEIFAIFLQLNNL